MDVAKSHIREHNREHNRELLTLAWPAILEMMLYMTVWIVDTAMVGRVSPVALAAVGIGGQFVFLVSWIFASIGIGATALVARAMGAGDSESAVRAASHAFSVALLGAGVFAILGIWTAPRLVGLLTKDPDVLTGGISYARILFAATVCMIPLGVSNSILRGSGDTKTPMVVAGITNITNIVLDYILIFGKLGFPALGVVGAAIASALSQVVGFIIMSIVLFRGLSRIKLIVGRLFLWNKDLLAKLFRLAAPAALEEALMSAGRTIYIAMVAQLGTVPFAANQVVNSVESLSFMPGWGFAIAASTLVGQHLGAKSKQRAIAVGYTGVRWASIFMGIIGLLFVAFPRAILAVFTKDPTTIAIGAICLRIAGIEQVPIALSMTLAGAMRGAGETRYPLFVSAVGNYLVRIPLVYMVVFVFGWGLAAVWAVTVIDWTVRAMLLWWKYREGKWAKETI